MSKTFSKTTAFIESPHRDPVENEAELRNCDESFSVNDRVEQCSNEDFRILMNSDNTNVPEPADPIATRTVSSINLLGFNSSQNVRHTEEQEISDVDLLAANATALVNIVHGENSQEKEVGPTPEGTRSYNGNDVQTQSVSTELNARHKATDVSMVSKVASSTGEAGNALAAKPHIVGVNKAHSDETAPALVKEVNAPAILPACLGIPPPDHPARGKMLDGSVPQRVLTGQEDLKTTFNTDDNKKKEGIPPKSQARSEPTATENVQDERRLRQQGTTSRVQNSRGDEKSDTRKSVLKQLHKQVGKFKKPMNISEALCGHERSADSPSWEQIMTNTEEEPEIASRGDVQYHCPGHKQRLKRKTEEAVSACMTSTPAKRPKLPVKRGSQRGFDKRNPADSETDATHRPLPNAKSSTNPIPKEDASTSSMEVDIICEHREKPSHVKTEAEREVEFCQADLFPTYEFCLTCREPVEPDHNCQDNINERVIDNSRTFQ